MSTQLPDRPWQQLGSDLLEYRGKHYLLLVDYFSRFPEIRLLHDQSTASVITACRDIFACHGIPERFISDNGPRYASKEFCSVAGLRSVVNVGPIKSLLIFRPPGKQQLVTSFSSLCAPILWNVAPSTVSAVS